MNTSTTALSIAALGLAGACAYLFHEMEVERDRAHTEASLRIEQQTRIAELEKDRARLERQLDELRELLASQQTAWADAAPGGPGKPAATPTPQTKPPAMSEPAVVANAPGFIASRRADFLERMLEDPATRKSMRAQQIFAMRSMYGDFVKEAGLTPEEAERLIELLVDQQMKNMETARTLREDPTALSSAMQETQDQTRTELLNLLGSERYAQFEQYPDTLADRMQLRQLRDQLEFSSIPLSAEQSSQLLAAMQEERNRVPPPAASPNTAPEQWREAHTKWADDYDRRLRERAGQVLTPEQLKRFVEIQQQQANMRRMVGPMRFQAFGSSGAMPAMPAMSILRSPRP